MISHRARIMLSIIAGVFAFLMPAMGYAQGIRGFFHSIGVDTARNNCWPDAFVPADRANTRLPFAVMVQNGWKYQNLIADHYFAEDGKTLTEAGQRRIEWILTQTTSQHRTIYLQAGKTDEITIARLDAVQNAAATCLLTGDKLDIRITRDLPLSWPAEYVDHVERAYIKTMPDPRLPERSTNEEQSGFSGN